MLLRIKGPNFFLKKVWSLTLVSEHRRRWPTPHGCPIVHFVQASILRSLCNQTDSSSILLGLFMYFDFMDQRGTVQANFGKLLPHLWSNTNWQVDVRTEKVPLFCNGNIYCALPFGIYAGPYTLPKPVCMWVKWVALVPQKESFEGDHFLII